MMYISLPIELVIFGFLFGGESEDFHTLDYCLVSGSLLRIEGYLFISLRYEMSGKLPLTGMKTEQLICALVFAYAKSSFIMLRLIFFSRHGLINN